MPYTYELPNGTTTKDEDVYNKEWLDLIRPIRWIADLKIVDFNASSITLCTYDKKTVINLPVWFLKEFNKGLEKHDYDIRYMEHCTCGDNPIGTDTCPYCKAQSEEDY